MRLDGKVVLVTGASRGIGQAAAVKAAKAGAQVIVHGRSEESLLVTIEKMKEASAIEPFSVFYDVRDEQAVRKVFQTIKKEFGKIDGVVANAGIMTEGLLMTTKMEQVEELFAVNAAAVLQHIQLASRFMMQKRSGSIVAVSSIMGVKGAAGSVAYSASKAAVIGAVKAAAKELAGANIRVNAVAPGFIETDLTAHYEGERRDAVLETIQMKRFGKPEEVADALLFLLSDYSSYITGQVIGIDGGMVI